VLQTGEDPQVPRGPNHGLDRSARPSLEIQLDPGVPQRRSRPRGGSRPCGEPALDVRADPPVEDQRHLIRATNLQFVLDQGIDERPSVCREALKDQVREISIWRIDSSHHYSPERVGLGQRQRQPGHPPFEEHPSVAIPAASLAMGHSWPFGQFSEQSEQSKT
jgi:hypothetical protein